MIEHVPSKYQLADIFMKPLPTCTYAIKLWGGRQIQLGVWDHHLMSSQYCLEQYCTSYSTLNRFHLSFVYYSI